MNREAMAAAIADFLRAADQDLSDPELVDTPARVAEAWADTYLAGAGVDGPSVKTLLGETLSASSEDLVILTHLRFVSTCPHHLLPYPGEAHLAYRPAGKVAGFGQLARLVHGLGAGLILQETLGARIADALMDPVQGLAAAGAACILDGWPMCVATRGVRDPGARTRTSALRGSLQSNAPDLSLLLEGLAAGPHA